MVFKFKPFYCVLPSEKEKQSCVCINCQNPYLLLQAVNRYRISKHLDERVIESSTKQDGTRGEYKRVTPFDYHEPVKDICKKLLETGDAYLKQRTYVDNVLTVFLK